MTIKESSNNKLLVTNYLEDIPKNIYWENKIINTVIREKWI